MHALGISVVADSPYHSLSETSSTTTVAWKLCCAAADSSAAAEGFTGEGESGRCSAGGCGLAACPRCRGTVPRLVSWQHAPNVKEAAFE